MFNVFIKIKAKTTNTIEIIINIDTCSFGEM